MITGDHGAVISTAFTHMRTVSAFSMQKIVATHYATLTQYICAQRIKRSLVAGLGFGGANLALFCTYALLFWYGAKLIKSGEIDFEELMIAILSLMLGALGLGTALTDLGDQKVGVQVASRIFKCIDDGKSSAVDGLSTVGGRPSLRAQGKIEIRNVNFHYPSRPDVEVCKNFSLVIEPGEMVAFVGPSGCGKSTIINLLQRFYDPDSGDILLDGVPLRTLNPRWLRAQLGYVGQEPVLFTGSVASNIAKGRAADFDLKAQQDQQELLPTLKSLEDAMMEAARDEKASLVEKRRHLGPMGCVLVNSYFDCGSSFAACCPAEKSVTSEGDIEMGSGGLAAQKTAGVDDDIIQACTASYAHEFILGFPNGYHTDVGESSIMVSGGQKQRIAIARALVKHPSVLLLDEATSALDAASERFVQQSIDSLQQRRTQTTIVIAHRLSTIRNADKIIVIDKGVVVESGKHDELVHKGGLYASLWAKQGASSSGPQSGSSSVRRLASRKQAGDEPYSPSRDDEEDDHGKELTLELPRGERRG